MNTTIVKLSQNVEQKNDTKQVKSLPWYLAYPAATATGGMFSIASSSLAAKSAANDVKKLSQYVTPDVVDKTMNLPQIQKLGVRLNDAKWGGVNNSTVRELKEQARNLSNETLLGKLRYRFKKGIFDVCRKQQLQLPMGQNASYVDLLNEVNLNKQRGGAFVFHELGHAQNFKSTNLAMKSLTKMRSPFVSPLLMSMGLMLAFIPRATGEDADTFWGKTKNFLKDSSVGVTAIGALATPLEECIASIKGAKLAKTILPKEQLKMLNKMNGKALLSYLGVAVGSILTTYIVKKLTDKSSESESDNSIKKNKELTAIA